MKRSKILTRLLTITLTASMLGGEILPVMAAGEGVSVEMLVEGSGEAAAEEGNSEAAAGEGSGEASAEEENSEAAAGEESSEAAAEEGNSEAAAEEGSGEAAAEEGNSEAAAGEENGEAAAEEGSGEAAAEEGNSEAAAGEENGEAAAEEGNSEAAAGEENGEAAAEEGSSETAEEEGKSEATPEEGVSDEMPAESASGNEAAEEAPVWIEEDVSAYVIREGGFPQAMDSDEMELLGAQDNAELRKLIYQSLKNKAESFDVSAYSVSKDNFRTIYYTTLNAHPDLFYVEGGYTYYSNSSGNVTEVYPGYGNYSSSQINAFHNKVKEIISGVKSSWTDLQKALYLHDYLVTHCAYDTDYENYNAYYALVEGDSVCQGYAEAYEYLLQQIGVEGQIVTSDRINHAWNMLCLDGEWFYVDCTWDDPVNDSNLYCGHRNFLRSRSGMADTNHSSTDWVGGEDNVKVYSKVPGSTKYDSYFWQDIKAALPFLGRKTMCVSGSEGNVYDFESGTTKSYSVTAGIWHVWGQTSFYTTTFASTVAAGGRFYYSTENAIYSFKIDGTQEKVYSLSSTEASKGYIYEMSAKGNVISYYLKQSPSVADYTGSGSITVESEPVENAEIVLSESSLSFDRKKAGKQLSAKVYDTYGDLNESAAITWGSSDAGVAAVSEDGTVTSMGEGTATITAACGKLSAVCTVSVVYSEEVKQPAVISIEPEKLSFEEPGGSASISVTVWDGNEDLIQAPVLSYSSVDPTVAGVNEQGLVSAVGSGSTVISVKCGQISAACDVDVLYSVEFYVGAELYARYKGLKKGAPLAQLPADPEGDFLCWVDENGGIWDATCPLMRNMKLYAKFVTEAERSALCPLPEMNAEGLYLVKGQSFDVQMGEDKWSADDSKILSISKKGKLKAKKAGVTTIKDGTGKALYQVTVLQPALSSKSLNLLCGSEGELSISLALGEKEYRDEYSVFWYSSAPAVARVEATEEGCRVYAIGKGSASVTAYVNGTAYTAKVKVVEKKTAKLGALESEMTLSPLQSTTLKLKGVSFKNVSWSSNRGMQTDGKVWYDGVVMITKAGKLTAVGSGTSVLTCAECGAVITVTVPEPTDRTVFLNVGKKTTLKFDGVKSTKAKWECVENGGVVDEAMFTKNGTIKALKCGSAKLKCSYNPYEGKGEGFVYTVTVYVENPGLKTDGKLSAGKQYLYNLTLQSGDSYALQFENGDVYRLDQPVLFKSSNTKAAYVDEYGVVHCLNVSKKTKVKLTCKINGKTVKVSLTIEPKES